MRMILVFCLFVLCNATSAQNKTFRGFYIDKKGDTVFGSFPKYNHPNKTFDRILFAPDKGSTPFQLTPGDCLKFSVTGYDDYLYYSGKRLINPIDDNMLIENKEYFGSRDSVNSVTTFLRLVVQTPGCSVYLLNDNQRKNFFIELPGQPLQELRFKKYFDENNMHEMAEYRQQLSNLFKEEISKRQLQSELERLPYYEDAISQFVQKLFPVRKTVRSAEDVLSGWFVGGGISYNQINVTGNRDAVETQLDYPSSFAPYLSLGYFFSMKRNFNRYFIYPQVRFSSYKVSAEKMGSPFNKRITFRSDLMIVPQINVGANIVNKPSFCFYLYGGAGMTTLINNREVNEYFDPSDNSLHTTIEYKFQSLVANLNLSAGVSLKNRLQIIMSYNFPSDLDNFVSFSTNLSSLQVGIGYKLGKH